MKLHPVEGLKKMWCYHHILLCTCSWNIGQFARNLENAFDWKGCVLNHFTVGIHGTVLEYLQVPGCFSSTQPKVSVGIRKEVKCCQVVLFPTALTKSYTTAVRFVQAWSQATRDTSKSAQEQKGSRNFFSSHVGCIWSAQAADLNCLLCFIAVINMASKIKWPESCCWPRHGC